MKGKELSLNLEPLFRILLIKTDSSKMAKK